MLIESNDSMNKVWLLNEDCIFCEDKFYESKE